MANINERERGTVVELKYRKDKVIINSKDENEYGIINFRNVCLKFE